MTLLVRPAMEEEQRQRTPYERSEGLQQALPYHEGHTGMSNFSP